MCPSGDEVAMGDSDEFFMLELQAHDQEQGLLELGWQTHQQIARSLQVWTTAEHRRAARHEIVFHSGDLPANIGEVQRQASALVEDVGKLLGRPMPHAGHFYWLRGVAAWQRRRQSQQLTAVAPELSARSTGFLATVSNLLNLDDIRARAWEVTYAAYGSVYGRWPLVSALHPSWMDERHLQEIVAQAFGAADARVLIVRRHPEQIDPLIGERPNALYVGLDSILEQDLPAPEEDAARPNATLIYLGARDFEEAHVVVERCLAAMTPGGTCHVFVHDLGVEFASGNLSRLLLRHVEEVLGKPGTRATCTFIGGVLKRGAQSMMESMQRMGGRYGLLAVPLILPLFLIAMPLAVLANLVLRYAGPTHNFVPDCSSVAIRFESAAAPGN
jgi:hypothetical protein